MKITSYFLIAFSTLLLLSCSKNTASESKIIQHKEVLPTALDGPTNETKHPPYALNVKAEKESKEKLISKIQKQLNKAPQKSLENLKEEIDNLTKDDKSEQAALVYYQYGNALVKAKKYHEAIAAYQKAEKANFKDLKNLYYQLARTHSLANRIHGRLNSYLKRARKHGFRNYRALLYDSGFENLRKEQHYFMHTYQNTFRSNKKAMFKAFLFFSPKKHLSKDFEVDPVALFENTDYEYRAKVSYYKKHPNMSVRFSAFVNNLSKTPFRRGMSDGFHFEFALVDNKNYSVVVYSQEKSDAEYLLPKKYIMATFDKVGNKISELEIANRGSFSKCKGFVLHPDNSLEVTNYKIAFKEGAKRNSRRYEKRLRHKDLEYATAVDAQKYQINAKGRIVEVGAFISQNNLEVNPNLK